MNVIRFGRRKPTTRVEPLSDGALLHTLRDHRVVDSLRLGPNEVHAFITHSDGSITDLGVSHNVLTTSSAGGRDQMAALAGGLTATGGQGSPATGANATTFTATATPWTSNLLAGMQVVFPITGLTTTPVFGRIVSNTTSVATVDGWWAPDGTTAGTTPAGTSAFMIMPGHAPAKFMALTENAGAASAASTTLTGEITTGGCSRALATYAHTLASATYTLQKAFSVTASFPAIHKMGIFPFSGANGTLMFESVLNADATVVSGDSLTVTDTVTAS